jgi:hypothetical protein
VNGVKRAKTVVSPKCAKREEEDEPEARGTFALDRRTPSRDVMICDAASVSFVVYAIPSRVVTRVALAAA